MSTNTPNYNFVLPTVNSPTDEDLWGGELNANWSSIDTLLFNAALPPGLLFPFAGMVSQIPATFLLSFGQAVSRTTYANLFTSIGTAYGTGDGTTTFNLPDMRGRSVFGLDNMGGTGANRLTSAIAGFDPTVLGASGGNQNYQSHNHSVNDPGHQHHITGSVSESFSGQGSVPGVSPIGPEDAGTTDFNTTGITLNSSGTGSSGNIPPAVVINWIIKI